MIFPESTSDFATAWRMLFCFQIRFLRKPKHLHQVINQIVRTDYNIFDVNLQNNQFFDKNRVLGIALGAFNCYYNMVLGSPNLVYSRLVCKINVNLLQCPKAWKHLSIWFCERTKFTDKVFVSVEKKRTLFCFLLCFLWTRWTFTSNFTWNQKNKLSFPCELWRNDVFRKYIGLQNCSINIYLFLNIVPELAQVAHEKLLEFGYTKPLSLRKNNDFKR